MKSYSTKQRKYLTYNILQSKFPIINGQKIFKPVYKHNHYHLLHYSTIYYQKTETS